MVSKIPKDGKVWRLTRESWETLTPFDTDPNTAIQKMQAALNAPAGEKPNHWPVPQPTCKFSEDRLEELIRKTMEDVLKPFVGQ